VVHALYVLQEKRLIYNNHPNKHTMKCLRLNPFHLAILAASFAPLAHADDPFDTRSEEKIQEATILGLNNAGGLLEATQRVEDWLLTQPGQSRTEVSPDGTVSYIADVKNGIPEVIQTFNGSSAVSIGTNKVLPGGTLGTNLNGAGVIVGVWDGGDVLTTHQEFFSAGVSRVIDKDGVSAPGLSQHASHVTGTIGSAGVVLASRGMAIGATIHSRYFNNPAATMPQAVAQDGIKLSNHSYGFVRGWGIRNVGGSNFWAWYGDTAINQTEDYLYGFYSPASREVDEICYTATGYLPVWAAANKRGGQGQGPAGQPIGHYAINNGSWVTVFGVSRPNDYDNNAGYDLLSDHAVGKNVLTVAAVEDLAGGYNPVTGPTQVAMSSFSSFGPPDDGRIKPDVAANGVDLYSTDKDSISDYATLGGTSMAAPSVTGSTALLVQRYTQLYGSSNDLLSSTMKDLICHTADEAGSASGPDYRFGWGLMNTASMIGLLNTHHATGDRLTHIKQVVLGNGDFVEFTVKAIGGTTPLKVTGCWTDPAGTVPAKALDADVAALVNDLDVRVTQGATTYYPWKLNPASFTAAATNISDNNRDNVEQVLIASPTAAQTYTVRVTHKGTLKNASGATAPQMLSLVLTGIEDSPALPFQVNSITKVAGQPQYDISWNSVVGGVYNIETSLDLSIGGWAPVASGISATKSTSIARVTHAGETKRFWRVTRTK
jgi:subtilisin family serine protease